MTQPIALKLENPAWAFALDFYGRPGVAEACLTLQDDLDADIVELVILLYAWSQLGMTLSQADGTDLRAEMEDWRTATVLPLRQIRRALKPARPDMPEVTKEILRTQVKKAELLAEQMQIAWAQAWLLQRHKSAATTESHPIPAWFLALPNGDSMPERCKQAIAVIVRIAVDMRH